MPDSALVSDACEAALRAFFSAAQRKRQAISIYLPGVGFGVLSKT